MSSSLGKHHYKLSVGWYSGGLFSWLHAFAELYIFWHDLLLRGQVNWMWQQPRAFVKKLFILKRERDRDEEKKKGLVKML